MSTTYPIAFMINQDGFCFAVVDNLPEAEDIAFALTLGGRTVSVDPLEDELERIAALVDVGFHRLAATDTKQLPSKDTYARLQHACEDAEYHKALIILAELKLEQRLHLGSAAAWLVDAMMPRSAITQTTSPMDGDAMERIEVTGDDQRVLGVWWVPSGCHDWARRVAVGKFTATLMTTKDVDALGLDPGSALIGLLDHYADDGDADRLESTGVTRSLGMTESVRIVPDGERGLLIQQVGGVPTPRWLRATDTEPYGVYDDLEERVLEADDDFIELAFQHSATSVLRGLPAAE